MEPTGSPFRDAGFWLRLLAWVVDAVIVLPLAFAVGMSCLVLLSGGSRDAADLAPNAAALVTLFVLWLYFAVAESSGWQATLGKRLLGLRVVGAAGGGIGFGRASARFFAKLLSSAPLLGGFALAGVTRNKQGLHDLLASTRVVRAGAGRVWLASALGLAAAGLLVAGVVFAATQLEQKKLRGTTATAMGRVAELAAAEQDLFERTGTYLPIAAPVAGALGKDRRPWSRSEIEAAQAIGWRVADDQATSFTYRLVVDRTSAGKPTWAACAEADLDGDGVVQAIIAFQPAEDAQGVEVAPPAPCTHAPRLEVPLTYTGRRAPTLASGRGVY
jgi:uncharacterized RDD family membrane protein YckC